VNVFAFEIFTPYRLFYKGEVEYVVLKLVDGELGVFAGHTPLTAPVSTCVLRLKDKTGALKHALVSDGIIEVKNQKTVILADSANWPEEIDVERARIAKAEAERVISDNSFKLDTEKARKKLKRAEIRLKLFDEVQKAARTGRQ
jgi:F-type H+-transporting ATPase subunit epsilon